MLFTCALWMAMKPDYRMLWSKKQNRIGMHEAAQKSGRKRKEKHNHSKKIGVRSDEVLESRETCACLNIEDSFKLTPVVKMQILIQQVWGGA